MALNGLTALLLICLVKSCSAIPEGFGLKVTSECGDSDSGIANITVSIDIPSQITAVCVDGDHSLNVTSKVNYILRAHYSSDGKGGCQFLRRAGTRTYLIYIMIVISNDEVGTRQVEDQYTVTCDFGQHGTNRSNSIKVVENYLAPLEIQQNVGPEAKSDLQIYLININGDSIANNSELFIMTSARLVVETDGAEGEQGLQVTSCDALGSKDGSMKYPLIRAGCGDGLLLKKDVGFVTKDRKAVSSSFSLFHVAKDKTLKFACNVTLCKEKCDGSSCENERIRRNTFGSDTDKSYDEIHDLREESLPLISCDTSIDYDILVTIATCLLLVLINILLFRYLFTRNSQKLCNITVGEQL